MITQSVTDPVHPAFPSEPGRSIDTGHPIDPATAELFALVDQPTSDRGFALLRRRGQPHVELLVGRVVDVDLLADLPLPEPGDPPVLAAVPFRQVRERGFVCHDDGAPLRALVADRRVELDGEALAALLHPVPRVDTTLQGAAFTVDDDAYAALVKRVIEDVIGQGEGANFVIRRDLLARIDCGSATLVALQVFRRLLADEPAAYWTYAVQLGGLTMVGASPERHVSVQGGQLTMNPVSGTYRYPAGVPDRDGLLAFLRDPKEIEELSMVLDEELKMMSALCTDGGRVHGPFLRAMSALAHTSYDLIGQCRLDVREVLRRTMFAATLTGSPVENACRVIAAFEPDGRGYYGAALAHIDRDATGEPRLDAPILIRTAYLEPEAGGVRVRIPVGATLVRHSVPEHEVAETHAKVAALRRAFEPGAPTSRSVVEPEVGREPDGVAVRVLVGSFEVRTELGQRNADLAPFWMQAQSPLSPPSVECARLAGRRVLVVDAEDDWTAMLAHLLRRFAMAPSVVRWDGLDGGSASVVDAAAADLVVVGPGPGDPRAVGLARLDRLSALLAERLATGAPTLAVCLSHQLLAARLGLALGPLPAPNQGTQRRVPVFGGIRRVGFYNTFSAWVPAASVAADGHFELPTGFGATAPPGAAAVPAGVAAIPTGTRVTGWAVPSTGEVLALEVARTSGDSREASRDSRQASMISLQFHLESVISPDGQGLLAELLGLLCPKPVDR